MANCDELELLRTVAKRLHGRALTGVIAAGLMLGLVGGLVSAAAAELEAVPMPPLPPDPCIPFMESREAPVLAQALSDAGFMDSIPARVTALFRVASVTCLADRHAGRVQTIMLRLRDQSGDDAGLWLLLPTDSPESLASWEEYAESVRRRELDFATVGSALVAAERTDLGKTLLTQMRTDGDVERVSDVLGSGD